jgi:hypothetical protein
MYGIDQYIQQLSINPDVSSLPADYAQSLEAELCRYIEQIGEFESIQAAGEILIDLGNFQEKLATLSFRYNLELPDKLNYFVKLYDRPDDPTVREELYLMVRKHGDIWVDSDNA